MDWCGRCTIDGGHWQGGLHQKVNLRQGGQGKNGGLVWQGWEARKSRRCGQRGQVGGDKGEGWQSGLGKVDWLLHVAI